MLATELQAGLHTCTALEVKDRIVFHLRLIALSYFHDPNSMKLARPFWEAATAIEQAPLAMIPVPLTVHNAEALEMRKVKDKMIAYIRTFVNDGHMLYHPKRLTSPSPGNNPFHKQIINA